MAACTRGMRAPPPASSTAAAFGRHAGLAEHIASGRDAGEGRGEVVDGGTRHVGKVVGAVGLDGHGRLRRRRQRVLRHLAAPSGRAIALLLSAGRRAAAADLLDDVLAELAVDG